MPSQGATPMDGQAYVLRGLWQRLFERSDGEARLLIVRAWAVAVTHDHRSGEPVHLSAGVPVPGRQNGRARGNKSLPPGRSTRRSSRSALAVIDPAQDSVGDGHVEGVVVEREVPAGARRTVARRFVVTDRPSRRRTHRHERSVTVSDLTPARSSRCWPRSRADLQHWPGGVGEQPLAHGAPARLLGLAILQSKSWRNRLARRDMAACLARAPRGTGSAHVPTVRAAPDGHMR